MNKQVPFVHCVFYLLILPVFATGQFAFKNIQANELPKAISYKGDIEKSVYWNDSLGKHFIVLSEEGPLRSTDKKDSLGFCEDGECKDAFIYAYHFLQRKDSIILVCKTVDYVTQCSFDIYASFENNSLNITDLDKNGVPEIWFIYKTTCTSDVSPKTTKLLMYEGNKKHIARGTSRVKISATEYIGGERKFDSNFNMANQQVKTFAIQLWDKFVKDTFN